MIVGTKMVATGLEDVPTAVLEARYDYLEGFEGVDLWDSWYQEWSLLDPTDPLNDIHLVDVELGRR